MIWSPWSDARVRAAAVAAAVAVLLMLNEARIALSDELVVPSMTAAEPVPARPVASGVRAAVSLAALFGVAEGAGTTDANTAPTPYVAPIRLIGTVAGTDEPSALCQLGADAPRILHVGYTLGGWRLQHVAPAAVVFIDAAGIRHELRLSPSGN